MVRVSIMREARQIIRDQLRRKGHKPCHYAMREISLTALQYAREHWAELEAQAFERIMSSPGLRAEWEKHKAA
jgi:hypothetical protein